MLSLKFVFTYRESARAKSFSKCRSPNAASLGKQLDIRMRESGIGTRIPRSPLLLSVYHFGRTHIQHKIFPWLDQRKWWEVAGRPFRTAMHFESLVGPLKISALGCGSSLSVVWGGYTHKKSSLEVDLEMTRKLWLNGHKA